MENIEIGEYVRTTDGIIGKIEEYTNNEYHIKISENDIWKCGIDNIKSHSKDLIDVLEEGDFCNNELIKVIFRYKDKSKMQYIKTESKNICEFKINTILTHEQYEQNCFRMEE